MKLAILFLAPLLALDAFGASIDMIDGTLLHQVDPTLQGSGVPVAQPEAANGAPGLFEIDPSGVGQPTNLFTWISADGTATNYPNSLGGFSGHAEFVANEFYGKTNGLANQVSHVDNYDADYFYNQFIQNGTAIGVRVVNQSFIFTADANGDHYPTNEEEMLDAQYDDFASEYGVLFVSGAGNGGRVYPAATCYNGIGVGVINGDSSFGPTGDGRCKPDIVSPGDISLTSFSTPFVSGAAAVLIQAALRGDGGADTNSANDNRTIKALILNGATKPSDWTNSVISPLDARYGSGVLNVFNSWTELKGGKHAFIESSSVSIGTPHLPGANPANEPTSIGWDYNSLTNPDPLHDQINHYYFTVTGSNSFIFTSTLVWLRPHSTILNPLPAINDLNLFLYNTANNSLVLCSTSAVDNVEHLYIPGLLPGRYDLQVEKNASGNVSLGETYALAFEFSNTALNITPTNGNALVSWPLAPAGFQLQSATDLGPPTAWSNVTAAVSVDTNAYRNVVLIPNTGGNQFFRLER